MHEYSNASCVVLVACVLILFGHIPAMGAGRVGGVFVCDSEVKGEVDEGGGVVVSEVDAIMGVVRI